MKTPLSLLVTAALAVITADAVAANPTVVISTSLGDITLELDEENAPLSTANFLNYVDSGFYDGTVFHRVIPNFMIQGGGFAKTGDGIEQKQSLKPVKNEAKNGLKNARGTVAMARTSNPHSATSQFFINVVDNKNLDYPSFDGWGYAVFGKVTEGMDIVDKIRNTPTTIRKLKARLPNGSLQPNDFKDVPQEDVVIKSVKRASPPADADADAAAGGDGEKQETSPDATTATEKPSEQ
jgi:cyclophilin family peptidyl-prolyl cis-trans isomerase